MLGNSNGLFCEQSLTDLCSFLEQHRASVNKTLRESGQREQSGAEEQAGGVCDAGKEVRAHALWFSVVRTSKHQSKLDTL